MTKTKIVMVAFCANRILYTQQWMKYILSVLFCCVFSTFREYCPVILYTSQTRPACLFLCPKSRRDRLSKVLFPRDFCVHETVASNAREDNIVSIICRKLDLKGD